MFSEVRASIRMPSIQLLHGKKIALIWSEFSAFAIPVISGFRFRCNYDSHSVKCGRSVT